MDPNEIMKQMIAFNKAVFENTFRAVTVILEEREKMLGMFFAQMPWLPEEGKTLVLEWVKSYQKSRNDFKAAIDENFKKIDDYFLQEDEKRTGSQ